MNSALEYLQYYHKARAARIGIVLRTNEPLTLQRRLWKASAAVGGSPDITIVRKDPELWLIKKEALNGKK